MTTCHECQRARETAGRCPWYCPKCLYCGARLIARLQVMQRPRSEIVERCRKVLADWMAMGHDEQQLRALAKGPMPLEPEGGPMPSGSETPAAKSPARKAAKKQAPKK